MEVILVLSGVLLSMYGVPGTLYWSFLSLTSQTLCTQSPPLKMYEFATGRWIFTPEGIDDISRNIVHLAQMTQSTGRDDDDITPKAMRDLREAKWSQRRGDAL